jgi:hypothetical protein
MPRVLSQVLLGFPLSQLLFIPIVFSFGHRLGCSLRVFQHKEFESFKLCIQQMNNYRGKRLISGMDEGGTTGSTFEKAFRQR